MSSSRLVRIHLVASIREDLEVGDLVVSTGSRISSGKVVRVVRVLVTYLRSLKSSLEEASRVDKGQGDSKHLKRGKTLFCQLR